MNYSSASPIETKDITRRVNLTHLGTQPAVAAMFQDVWHGGHSIPGTIVEEYSPEEDLTESDSEESSGGDTTDTDPGLRGTTTTAKEARFKRYMNRKNKITTKMLRAQCISYNLAQPPSSAPKAVFARRIADYEVLNGEPGLRSRSVTDCLQELLAHRPVGQNEHEVEYLVSWEGTQGEMSWESERRIHPDVIAAYQRRNRMS